MEFPYDMPGLQGVKRGHAEVGAFWREWLSAWDEVSVREFELEHAADEVLGVWIQDMRGRGSDLVMEEHQAAIFTLQDGVVTRVRFFNDPQQARAEFAR